MDKFAKYNSLAKQLLVRLSRDLEVHGHRENFGNKEAIAFNDKVMEEFSDGNLTYEQASGLSEFVFMGVRDL